jgi:pyridoxal phosphate enzyme (YggS family)
MLKHPNINLEAYTKLAAECEAKKVALVAVSKTKPVEDILALYELGHRDFGENYVQELVEKRQQLPDDIRWHFIGHLQSNKVKQIIGFIHLIHGADGFKLLQEINKQAGKINRTVDCLLQVHIAQEETKFGLNEQELDDVIQKFINEPMDNVSIQGVMGMASFTDDMEKVRNEFKYLKSLQGKYAQPLAESGRQTSNPVRPGHPDGLKLQTVSMGMTADYKIAIEEGSNMIRIGSLIFGERN